MSPIVPAHTDGIVSNLVILLVILPDGFAGVSFGVFEPPPPLSLSSDELSSESSFFVPIPLVVESVTFPLPSIVPFLPVSIDITLSSVVTLIEFFELLVTSTSLLLSVIITELPSAPF